MTKEIILNALTDSTKIVTYDDSLIYRDSDKLTLNYVTCQGVWEDKWSEVNLSKIKIYQEIKN